MAEISWDWFKQKSPEEKEELKRLQEESMIKHMEEIEAWEEDLRERIWELQKKIKQLEKEWTNNIQEIEQLQQELDKLIQDLDALIQIKRYKESQGWWWTDEESWALDKVKSFLFWQRNSLEVTRQNILNQKEWLQDAEESLETDETDKILELIDKRVGQINNYITAHNWEWLIEISWEIEALFIIIENNGSIDIHQLQWKLDNLHKTVLWLMNSSRVLDDVKDEFEPITTTISQKMQELYGN